MIYSLIFVKLIVIMSSLFVSSSYIISRLCFCVARSFLYICFPCLIGLAIAADPTFKTFEAAYPHVVQKLLVDNSTTTRRILNSVCGDDKFKISLLVNPLQPL